MCPPRKRQRNIGGCSTIEKMKEYKRRQNDLESIRLSRESFDRQMKYIEEGLP